MSGGTDSSQGGGGSGGGSGGNDDGKGSPSFRDQHHDELRSKPRSLIHTPVARQERELMHQRYADFATHHPSSSSKKARLLRMDDVHVFRPTNTMDGKAKKTTSGLDPADSSHPHHFPPTIGSHEAVRSVSCDDVFEMDRKHSADSRSNPPPAPRKLQLTAFVDVPPLAASSCTPKTHSRAISRYLHSHDKCRIPSLSSRSKEPGNEAHVFPISDEDPDNLSDKIPVSAMLDRSPTEPALPTVVGGPNNQSILATEVDGLPQDKSGVSASRLLYPTDETGILTRPKEHGSGAGVNQRTNPSDLMIEARMLQLGSVVKGLSPSMASIRCLIDTDAVRLSLRPSVGSTQHLQFSIGCLARVSLHLINCSSEETAMSYLDFTFGRIPPDLCASFGIGPLDQLGAYFASKAHS